jgi:hypothetical protein
MELTHREDGSIETIDALLNWKLADNPDLPGHSQDVFSFLS